jgi:hypothetical protein
MNTKHATVRAQQRCIQPFADELLDRYGQEEFDGYGASTVYFNKESKRKMERDLGKRTVARLKDYLGIYKIRGKNGVTITCGHRTRRIKRK